METVPTIRLERMSEAEKRAYIIADNKLAENAGWDRQLLALELEYLSELNLDFDLTVTGFETAEIDLLIGEASATDNALDELPAVDESAPAVSLSGDLWILGRHRLLCADARRLKSFEQLLGGRLAQVVFTDPLTTSQSRVMFRDAAQSDIASLRWGRARCRRSSLSRFLRPFSTI
jgi:hypothetical protein